MATSIANKLQILPGRGGGLIIVPGTEPSSELTSTVLFTEMKKAGIVSPSIITAHDALIAIPEGQIIIMENTGGILLKFFVIPPRDITCPCIDNVDWYEILRLHASPASTEEVDQLRACGAFGGYDKLEG